MFSASNFKVFNAFFSSSYFLASNSDSKHSDESGDDEYPELFGKTVSKTKKAERKNERKVRKLTFQEQIIQLQTEQMAIAREAEGRNATFLQKVMEEQRKSDAQEREKDRELLLTLGRLFATGDK